MIDQTHHYIAKLAITVGLAIIVGLCIHLFCKADAEAPSLHQVRARHIISAASLVLFIIILAIFGLTAFS